MPTDLKPREADSDERFNTASDLAEREFDFSQKINDGQHDRIEGYDRSADGLDAYEREFSDGDESSNSDNSSIDKDGHWNYNSDIANEAREKTEAAEKNPDASPIKQADKNEGRGNKKALLGGKGAAIALATGGTGMLVLVGMVGNLFGSLLNNLAELLKNENTSTRTNMLYGKATAAHQFTKGKCDGKVQIFCRFANMSEKRKVKLERAGFQILSTETDSFGRHKVTGYIAPDGTRIENGRDLQRWANSSSSNARLMNLATKGKVAYWWNQKTHDINNRWGINKLKKLVGRDRSQIDQSMNSNTNGNGEEGTNDENRQRARDGASESGDSELKKSVGDISNRVGKSGWIAAAVVGACGVYNMSHKMSAYAKNYHIEQMIKYANVFLNTADRIKDLGDVEPEVISYAGKIMTDPDPREKITVQNKDGDDVEIDNPDYMKTFMDSQAYETVTHGDTQKLSPSAAKFRPGGSNGSSSWLQDIAGFTRGLEMGASGVNPSSGPLELAKLTTGFASAMTGGMSESELKSFYTGALGTVREGRQTIRYACTAGEDAALVGYMIMCAISVAELFTGALTAPGAAQVAGCAFAAGCSVGQYLPWKPCETAMQAAMDLALDVSKEIGLTDKILSYLQSTVLGSFTQYTDAGNAAGAGNAFLAQSTSMGYGLRPAKDAAEVQNFVASTNADMAMEEQIAYEDARSTPFDISNRYSFLGTVLRKANIYVDDKAPIYSSILSMAGLIPRSFAYNDTTYATYSQPLQSATKRYDCNDPDLIAIGITQGDKFCSATGITPEAELVAARKQADDTGGSGNNDLVAQTLEYMTTPQLKNEDGGGTYDDSFCGVAVFDALINTSPLAIVSQLADAITGDDGDSEDGRPCQIVNFENSTKPSIDENGKTIEGSQYDMYTKYCTEARKDPLGTFSTAIQEAKSNRDLDWWTGEQCLKDTPMMANFRTYYNLCSQIATMDDTKGCWTDEPMDGGVQEAGNVTNSDCSSNGDTKSIYTCALKYDNYRYSWGGGHDGNAQDWIAKFKSGTIPEWEPILDCSGLVRMAFVEAMGIEDQAYVAPGGYGSSKYWEKIPLEQAQQGDIVTSSGHVAIIEANDPAAKSFKIFHASTSDASKEDNIKHGTQSYDGAIATYRAKKGVSV